MKEDITLSKIFQRIPNIKPSIIVDIDDYLEIPDNSHFKGVNLNEEDLRILIDLYHDIYQKKDVIERITYPLYKINTINLHTLECIGLDIISYTNYNVKFPDLDLLQKVIFQRKSYGKNRKLNVLLKQIK